MRNFLTARWRRYAVAFVVVAASLGVIGACNPTKKQPPPTTPCGTGVAACLTIAPTEWVYTSVGEIKNFTVTNLGPNPSGPLHETLVFGDPGGGGLFTILANPDDCQDFHSSGLVVGGKCTVRVQGMVLPDGHHQAFLLVGLNDNVQVDPNTGQRGVSANLSF